jgi:hypothetical protein
MKITVIKINEAVGLPLAHDLTKIDAKSGTKGARFKKGQIIKEEDLPVLLDMGRENLSIIELESDELHEDDAAEALCRAIRGKNCSFSPPNEGRINLRAELDGLLYYDPDMVSRVNEDSDWVLATIAPFRQVRAAQVVAGFRIRPLVMSKERVNRAVSAAGRIDVFPFLPQRAGLITVGSEIISGRIEDVFRDRFREKISAFGGSLIGQKFCTDDPVLIASSIAEFLKAGAEMIVCTGGMSVDADDRTPGGISLAADRIAFQGVPVLPGGMLMMGYAAANGCDVPIIGAPACVVHDERTALDRILPFLFADIDPTPYVRSWGVGGLCEGCSPCHWPECRFSSGA